MWISPDGDGWAVAAKLREAGNKVIYFCPDPNNKNGLGYLPRVSEAEWLHYAKRSDLVIVDNNFDSRRTRRSFAPSKYVEDLGAVRRLPNVQYIGPVPTSELIENDLRYQAKIAKRLGLNYTRTANGIGSEANGLRVTLSYSIGQGIAWLVWRHKNLLGDNNGPDVGNLGDCCVPISFDTPLCTVTLQKVTQFFEKIKFTSYINLSLCLDNKNARVCDITTGFLYPAIFCQFAGLPSIGLAVTLFRFEDQSQTVDLVPGFFPANVEASGKIIGSFAGAVAGVGEELDKLQLSVYTTLQGLTKPYLGYRDNIGIGVPAQMALLREWGWL